MTSKSTGASAEPTGHPRQPSDPATEGGPAGGSTGSTAPEGAFTQLEGEAVYRISGYDAMPPFLMSVPSDTDLWMYVASSGGLTAGRVDADGSLFPYETVDRLEDAHHHTGPITLLRVRRGRRPEVLWEPFSDLTRERFSVERNLYKNVAGNRVVFEEINHDLGLAFRYRWSACDRFGLVRTATLENRSSAVVSVSMLDGLRNVLPYGAPLALYQQSSSLVDAYKRTDLDAGTGLAIYSLTAKIVDRPEAAEMLRANTVWCAGLESFAVSLSGEAVAAFRAGDALPEDAPLSGKRGNYLVSSLLVLEPGSQRRWHLAADAGRDHLQVAEVRAMLASGGTAARDIDRALEEARENLLRNVGSADGIQRTASLETSVHHFANVLFNNMRGGVFADGYDIPAGDFADFLETRNRSVAGRRRAFLAGLPATTTLRDLLEGAERTGDADLLRLAYEYLPLSFGRRHGDPSRPWNRFTIHVRNPDGSRALRYEGNWRDIFQNWEALALSFPGFLPSMVAKFVNASTVDGFNPYRITRDGIDWEVEDPDHPWSHIGYWGDHQIVYLLKLLEASVHHDPDCLDALLDRALFSYADVPYRIDPYGEIVRDPHATIRFDTALAARIDERVAALGTDGKLLPDGEGGVHHVTLLEKLLVPALSKLSNLVPDGGIWMNTQRPEWNDANNALVGNGISMVTLCYLRRYMAFLVGVLEARSDARFTLSREVASWLADVGDILARNRGLLATRRLDDRDRRRMLDALGEAFSAYRARVYAEGFSGTEPVEAERVLDMCRDALAHLDHAIRANRRDDGLYHAYNLLELAPGGGEASVLPLQEMLEGQVAALSSGAIGGEEALRLLDRLFAGPLYRTDQNSFQLYPERELPSFLDRNRVPEERARAVPLLRELLQAEDVSILARDAAGVLRFHGGFSNASDLAAALDRLAAKERWSRAVARDRAAVLEVFEAVFDHRSFTGRSGTMVGYEGLGCIYWHMVAKLLLAVQETVFRAARDGEPECVIDALGDAYFRIRAGLGFTKPAGEYGAFPMDPYSHTPPGGGAKQPGMTGQVKEEILTRFGELGVHVEAGRVSFRPRLLPQDEFLPEPVACRVPDREGNLQELRLPARSLGFTYCGTPVVYVLGEGEPRLRVTGADGSVAEIPGDTLDPARSRALFERGGGIARIEVAVREGDLRRG